MLYDLFYFSFFLNYYYSAQQVLFTLTIWILSLVSIFLSAPLSFSSCLHFLSLSVSLRIVYISNCGNGQYHFKIIRFHTLYNSFNKRLLCWSGLPSLFVVPVTTFNKQSNYRHCQEAFLGTKVNKLQSSQQLIPASTEPRTTQWFVRRESVCQWDRQK